eukprot:898687-Pyramimonas_sp.AAC.1
MPQDVSKLPTATKGPKDTTPGSDKIKSGLGNVRLTGSPRGNPKGLHSSLGDTRVDGGVVVGRRGLPRHLGGLLEALLKGRDPLGVLEGLRVQTLV